MNHHGEILRLAVPSIISNITVPLLGLVDVAIAGHIGDASYIGAIAIGSMIFNVIYWLFGFLRMGTSGMTSQAVGRNDHAEQLRLLLRSLGISLGVALMMIVLQLPLRHLALYVMNTPTDIQPLVTTYFNIVVWGAIPMLGLYALTGWFIGMQDTRTPMFVAITQNVVNIIASLVLVFGLGLRIEGVAAGTLIAQWSGFLLSVWLAKRKTVGLTNVVGHSLTWRDVFAIHSMGRFFRVNQDIFLRTLFLVGVNLFFTSAGARHGTMILAVNTLLMILFTLFSYVMDGFAYAGEALAGKYYGAQNYEAFRTVVGNLFVWGVLSVFLFTVVYVLGGTSFLSLLTDDTKVVEASSEYLPWAYLIPITGVAAFIFDGVFIGITASRGMLISSAIAAVCFFVVYFLLSPFMGNHALWLAFLVFLSMRGIVQWWYLGYIKRRLAKN